MHVRIPMVSSQFVHHDNLLSTRCVDGKGCPAPWAKRGMTMLRGLLNVLRVVILAVYNDQVLQASKDVQFRAVQETKVASAQKWTVPGRFNVRIEAILSLEKSTPVATRDTRTCNPDLA